MRVIGASEKIASVTAGRINWLSAARKVSKLPLTRAVDQIEAGDVGRRRGKGIKPADAAQATSRA